MKLMVYTSKRGKKITFDDFTDETQEYGTYWVEMCRKHHKKYRGILGNKCDDGSAMGTCSVKGCDCEAEYYVDFPKDEVHFIQGLPYTNRITSISISEKTYTKLDVHPALMRSERIIVHDGGLYRHGCVHDEKELQEMLEFLETEMTDVVEERKWHTTGKIRFFNLTKNINSPCGGGFWSLEQLYEMAGEEKLKKFKGLSNGSLVDCYAGIGKNVINIYRPNPNAKEVYKTMNHSDELKYRKEHWYL